jgi:hypothetical protein
MFDLPPPRHISTLRNWVNRGASPNACFAVQSRRFPKPYKCGPDGADRHLHRRRQFAVRTSANQRNRLMLLDYLISI